MIKYIYILIIILIFYHNYYYNCYSYLGSKLINKKIYFLFINFITIYLSYKISFLFSFVLSIFFIKTIIIEFLINFSKFDFEKLFYDFKIKNFKFLRVLVFWFRLLFILFFVYFGFENNFSIYFFIFLTEIIILLFFVDIKIIKFLKNSFAFEIIDDDRIIFFKLNKLGKKKLKIYILFLIFFFSDYYFSEINLIDDSKNHLLKPDYFFSEKKIIFFIDKDFSIYIKH